MIKVFEPTKHRYYSGFDRIVFENEEEENENINENENIIINKSKN
jgi:hypothetical protein